MAAPNIVNVTAIYGNTYGAALTSVDSFFVNNIQSSGKVYKINSLYISNIHGTASADVNVTLNTAYITASANTRIASTISVPADSTLVLITKDTSFYIKEEGRLNITTNLNSHLEAVISWDEIN